MNLKFLKFGPTSLKVQWLDSVGPFLTIIAHIYNNLEFPLQSPPNDAPHSIHPGRINNV